MVSALRKGGRNDESYNFKGTVRPEGGTGKGVAAMITFQGQLYWRGDDGYEQERVGRVFNGRKPDRYPAAILKAVSEEDVIAGVRLARERGLKVSVRAGGHSWAAWSVRDDALLIDLAGMREISLDTDTLTVLVSPAVTGDELNSLLAEYGLIFPGGHCPTVGLGGFLLQGGMGWNCRGWGWACENIEAIDVVTANGELVRADDSQNAELLWAARGSGPGYFGIVTRFHLKVRPIPKAITRSTYIYPRESFDEVMFWIHEMQSTLAPTVEVVLLGATVPLPPEVEHVDGSVLVVRGVAFANTRGEAVEALAPFETCPIVGKALVHEVAIPTSLAVEYEEQRRANPEKHRYAVDNIWTNAGADDVVSAMRDAFVALPTEKSFSLWFGMAPQRHLPDMALSLQADTYYAAYVVWEDEADDERCREWLATQMRRMEPISEGLYLGDSDLATRPSKFLSGPHWERLEKLRARYDPDGLFHSYLAAPGTPLNVDPWTERA
jgi:FAD/FMN-containing dehydrogenase